ncbi:Stringent starvation protein B [Polaromonas vacuolata]|uniref:Stringent starvation protein B n=1 Tax=Polaromonas vacuolata TaxID=37448 RepID=A0A6H2HCF7_9BURK|nr:ClpXP protease specificity-enhancing factor [Polaromonas vacuolata]QJC57559.1 Stringent starvation protein B [Polaromonas vacuolata]
MNLQESSSTRPYLIRALYEWCTDNGFTPYVAVAVDDSVHVPREYVKNNEIVLNISFDATSSLQLGNEFIEFKARFAGSSREIMVPIERVTAIYARENGQGMAFPMPNPASSQPKSPVKSTAKSPSLALSPRPAAETFDDVLDSPAQTLTAADHKGMHLVTGEGSASAPPDSDGEPPVPPKPKSGSRPSLTRIK